MGFPGSSAWSRIHLQCRRPWFNSWVWKIPWRRNRLLSPVFMGFLGGSDSKESAYSVGDLGLISGLVRSLGVMKSYPLQYSALENSMDCLVHGVTNRRTGLSNFHFQLLGLVICYLPLTASISVSPTPWH